jgi:hypothetical protein
LPERLQDREDIISNIRLCEKVCKLLGTSELVLGARYGWA